MLDLGIYFEPENSEKVLTALLSLPEPLCPKFFSVEESIRNRKDVVTDRLRLEKFRAKHPNGFCLFADQCRYNLTFARGGILAVDVYELSADTFENYLSLFFNILASAKPIFGYAADALERDHRNRHRIKLGKNSIESWVGRDLRRYLPGVYWITLLSERYLSETGVDFITLESKAVLSDDIDDGLHLLKFYDHAEEWQRHAAEFDALCEELNGIFSKKEFEAAIEGVSSYQEYSEIHYNWL